MEDEDLQQLVRRNNYVDVSKIKRLGLEALIGVTGFNTVALMYRELKKGRIEQFLCAVGEELECLTQEDRDKLDQHLQSAAGQQVLVEYVERATSTLSDWARHALALLFADELIHCYDKRFHRYAATALPGLSDDEIMVFLKLRDYTAKIGPMESASPIKMYSIPLDVEFFQPLTAAQLLEDLEEFQQRGLVLRDSEPGLLGGGESVVIIGWPEKCTKLADLLVRANQIAPRA